MEATEKAYFCYKYIMFDMDVCFISARCWEGDPNLQGSSAWLTAAPRWLQLQETQRSQPRRGPAPTALVQVTEAGLIPFSSATSSSHAQMSNSRSVACSIGKEGRFFKGMQCSSKKDSARGRNWLLPCQGPGPRWVKGECCFGSGGRSILMALTSRSLVSKAGTGWRKLRWGCASLYWDKLVAWAVKCQDNWCWAVLAESVPVPA